MTNSAKKSLQTRPSSELAVGGSGAMFDRIARRYDLLNRLMSLGFDHLWRARLIRALFPEAPRVGDELLDVATGTADVAIAAAQKHASLRVTGLDPSYQMLGVGQRKIGEQSLSSRVALVGGDAMAMPFDDGRFAGSCIAFGIRNVPDRKAGLAEMARVTRPGGKVAVLELTHPRGGLMSPLARFYVDRVLPRLGGWLSGDREYRYLAQSIAAFPRPAVFCQLMQDAGLVEITARRMHLGSVYLYVGTVIS
jgi:demethylmenaquinone methyltransferase/2-methoxy-6-polyprenyl-1,4-benzoquinol methylase